jgi:hypothetical protein
MTHRFEMVREPGGWARSTDITSALAPHTQDKVAGDFHHFRERFWMEAIGYNGSLHEMFCFSGKLLSLPPERGSHSWRSVLQRN